MLVEADFLFLNSVGAYPWHGVQYKGTSELFAQGCKQGPLLVRAQAAFFRANDFGGIHLVTHQYLAMQEFEKRMAEMAAQLQAMLRCDNSSPPLMIASSQQIFSIEYEC